MPFADYEDFDSCVTSNSDKSDPEAYCAAIKRKVEGEDSLSESEQKALEASKCDTGFVEINGECKPIEHVEDINPGALKNSASVLQLGSLEREPIEREELGDNKVAYRNLKILQAGVWRDSSSKTAIWYSPRGLSNMELTDDNSVNIMHDADNEVSEAGHMENLREEDGSLYADVIIDTSNAAGQYADENMQKTLETEGAKGFGGPSVEIPPEAKGGHRTEYNSEKGVRELVEGKVNGLGFVSNPASKPTSFARQAGTRAVALSESDQTVMQLESESGNMASDTKAKILEAVATRELQMDQIQDDAQAIADELGVSIDEVMEVLDPLLDKADEDVENAEDEEDQPGGDEEDEGDDEEDDEEDDMDMSQEEMAQKVQSLEERLTNLEDMAEQAMAAEDAEEMLSEELSEVKEELADAETVNELQDAKEELDKRLSSLENEPDNNRSLADGAEVGEPNEDSAPVKLAAEYDESSGTIRR